MTKATIKLSEFDSYTVTEKGEIISENGRLISQRIRNGYKVCTLFDTCSNPRNVSVHRLIGYRFLENDGNLEDLEINHKDGNRSNNSVDNLEFISHKENINHAYDTGLVKDRLSDNYPTYKLSFFDLDVMRSLWNKGVGCTELSNLFQISTQYVSYRLHKMDLDRPIKTLKKQLNLSDADKYTILYYREKGFTIKHISTILGTSTTPISKFLKKIREDANTAYFYSL